MLLPPIDAEQRAKMLDEWLSSSLSTSKVGETFQMVQSLVETYMVPSCLSVAIEEIPDSTWTKGTEV